MANEKDVLELVFQVTGAEQAQKLKEAIDQEKASVLKLDAALKAAGASQSQYAAQMAAAGAKMAAQSKELATLETKLRSSTEHTSKLGYKLMQFGQTLDDLQYVGQMGLQPILNNLMQISAPLGIMVLLSYQAYKNMDQLKEAGKGLAEYWGLDKTTTQTGALAEAWKAVKGAIDSVGDAFKAAGLDITALSPEGWRALTKAQEKEDKKTIEDFRKAPNAAEKGYSSAIGKALDEMDTDQVASGYGRKLQGTAAYRDDPKAIRHEVATFIGEIAAARKGDVNAIDAVRRKSEGTDFGAAIERNSPEALDALKKFAEAQKQVADATEESVEIHNKRAAQLREESKQYVDQGAQAMQARYGASILRGATQSATIDRIAGELLKTGQAKTEEEAAHMAGQIYLNIFAATSKLLRDRVNKTGQAAPAAAAHIAAELDKQARTEEQQAEVDRLRSQVEKRKAANRSFAARQLDRRAGETGLGGFILQAQLAAMNGDDSMIGGAAGRNLVNSDVRLSRNWDRMTPEEREKAMLQRQHGIDAALESQATQSVIQSGAANYRDARGRVRVDQNYAAAIAHRLVSAGREQAGGVEGDPDTKENTTALKDLTVAVTRLQRGVPAVIGRRGG